MECLFAVDQRSCDGKTDEEDPKASEKYKCEGIFSEYLRKFQPGYGQMKSVDR